jgi:uncharacterized phage protein gp47/JayE
MTWTRPTLQQIIDRIQGDALTAIGEEAAIPGSRTYNLVRVWAGVIHYLHGYQEAAVGEILPTTSTELGMLPQHAALWGVARLPAVAAVIKSTVTWTAAGPVIPDGTLYLGADGLEYHVIGPIADPGFPGTPTFAVPMTCQTAGAAGNRSAWATLTLASPIAGITDASVWASTTTTGTDQETVDDWRDRILTRARNTPQGGSAADWEAWALAYPLGTVTDAWATDMGLGAVRVLYTGTAVVGDLTTYLQGLTQRPVTMTPTALAATLTAYASAITLVPNTAATRAAVTAELNSLAARRGAPSTTIYNSEVRTAIGAAAGVTYYVLTSLNGDGTGNANLTTSATQVHTFAAPVYS